MPKIPSLSAIGVKASQAFARFPLTILSSVLAACVAIHMFENEPDIDIFFWLNILLSLTIGIPLFFSATLIAEQRKLDLKWKSIVYLITGLILFLIYLSLPEATATGKSVAYIRYLLFNISAHLIVSFIPYLKLGEYNGFWQFNKSLFIRILEAVLYSGFLFAGLALAMGALELLFDVDIREKLYFDLFLFIAGVFNTWFFVADIPSDFKQLDEDRAYPKGLKIFTQYILLPLLTIYLIILYSYGIKIILSWNWPEGIVTYLIVCVAVVGIFLVLLLWPYQKQADNLWIKRFSYIYYIALAPLVVMLFIAIGIRIGDYGITINRYIIVLLGIWLSITCAYYILGKKNIKFIPISLAAILLLSAVGPWSVFSVSERSQMSRLTGILANHDILENGQIKGEANWYLDEDDDLILEEANLANDGVLSDSLHAEVKSIITYLDDFHDLGEVRNWLSQDLDSMIHIKKGSEKYSYVYRPQIYMEAMGIPFYQDKTSAPENYNYTSEASRLTVVDGFEYAIHFDLNQIYAVNRLDTFRIDKEVFRLQLTEEQIVVTKDGKEVIAISLTELLDRLEKKHGTIYHYGISQSVMTVISKNQIVDAKVLFDNLSVRNKHNLTELQGARGTLLLKFN